VDIRRGENPQTMELTVMKNWTGEFGNQGTISSKNILRLLGASGSSL
jgi:hypothetical protein